MLNRAEIENFLTIQRIEIDFDKALTAITGESGAGKSLILRAVDTVFLQKVPTSVIGNFGEKSRVSLRFKVDKETTERLFAMFGIDEDELLIERILLPGRTKAYVNKEPVSPRVLSMMRPFLLDIVSQDYRFSAFDSDNLIKIMDRFVDRVVLDEFKRAYSDYRNLMDEKKRLENRIAEISEKHPEVLLEAIERVNPKKGEYEELLGESKRAKALSFVREEFGKIIEFLFEGEPNVESRMGEFMHVVEKAGDGGFDVDQIRRGMESILENLSEIKQPVYNMLDESLKGYDIDAIESRLFELEKLQRFFNMGVDDIVDKKDELGGLVLERENLKEELEELKKRLKEKEKLIQSRAIALRQSREGVASFLKEEILKYLSRMRLKGSRVDFLFEDKPVDESGIDRVSVLFSANPDMEPDRIEKVASGGERSRFILAVEASCAAHAPGTALFLDEVESGISGNTLRAVGDVMKELSKSHQVVLITHSPYFVEIANSAYRIEKAFEGGITRSYAEKLK